MSKNSPKQRLKQLKEWLKNYSQNSPFNLKYKADSKINIDITTPVTASLFEILSSLFNFIPYFCKRIHISFSLIVSWHLIFCTHLQKYPVS